MTSLLFTLALSLSPSMGERIYHDAPAYLSDSSITISTSINGLGRVTAEARVALTDIKEGRGMSKSSWRMSFVSPGDTLSVNVSHGNSDFGDILDHRFTLLSVSRGGNLLSEEEVGGFATGPSGYNTISAELDMNGILTVSGGSRKKEIVANIPLDSPLRPNEVSLSIIGNGTVPLFCCELGVMPDFVASSSWTMDALIERFRSSSDSAEGFWKYLDRENAPEYARMGGRYVIATVRNTAGGYDIVYVDGAQTMAEHWRPMMLKGRLVPTIFANHYDLEWIDSTFDTIVEDIHADIVDGAILSLSFPLLKTTVRYSKMPVR